MNTKIVSLVFGTALFFLSFTLMSFQQQTNIGDVNSNSRVIAPCSKSVTCPSGQTISCTGKRFCTSTATSVKCDGRTKKCGVDPANPIENN